MAYFFMVTTWLVMCLLIGTCLDYWWHLRPMLMDALTTPKVSYPESPRTETPTRPTPTPSASTRSETVDVVYDEDDLDIYTPGSVGHHISTLLLRDTRTRLPLPS